MKPLHNSQLGQAFIDWPVYLQRAIDLACNVMTARPNPRVGCVIVKDDAVIAEGWHRGAGQPHAEAMALGRAHSGVRGATAFVSLEPCSHYGRTGPCSEALIEAGVGRVIIAMTDPDPRVAGSGVSKLEEAGLEVFQLLDLEQAALEINAGFVKRHSRGLPYVRMKQAISLDGRTALANGRSKWITGKAARADVQRYRALSGAIVTGIHTVLTDDPQLDVRVEEMHLSEAERQEKELYLPSNPLRVVLDSSLRTPVSARVLSREGSTLIITRANSHGTHFDSMSNVEIHQLAQAEGHRTAGLNPASVLEFLASEYQCNEVLVEAGPTLCTSILQAGLVDELLLYMAPKLMGADAMPLTALQGFVSMEEIPQFEVKEVCQKGEDIKVVLRPSGCRLDSGAGKG